jgi:hypothetical protein
MEIILYIFFGILIFSLFVDTLVAVVAPAPCFWCNTRICQDFACLNEKKGVTNVD